MVRPQDKRVLVVDDEEDVVVFLSTALEDAGFQVDQAFSVDEALRMIRARDRDLIRCAAHSALISPQGTPHTFSV